MPLWFDILLFQTLAKVVDGWKKHESEKVAIINQLKVERENAEQSQQRQQEVTMPKFKFSGSNVSLAISNGVFFNYLLVNCYVSDVVAVWKRISTSCGSFDKGARKSSSSWERETDTGSINLLKVHSLDPLVLLGVEFQREREKVLRESNGIKDEMGYVYLRLDQHLRQQPVESLLIFTDMPSSFYYS